MVMLVRDVSPRKAFAPMDVTPLGIVISPVQDPIPVTTVSVTARHPFAKAIGADKPENRIAKATARPTKCLIWFSFI
jgi:hypothetical protein